MAWIAVDDGPAYAAWCVPIDGALYVLTGPGEQSVPGLADAGSAVVTLRGDHGGRIVSWPAEVSRLSPSDEAWSAVAPQVAAKRLNSPEPAPRVVQRWADECTLSRLTPAAAAPAAGAALPAGSLAAAVRETPATRRTWRPFRLHRVRRQR
ncbi:hypothetical protein [Plantactinospora sp. KBS50]|uniref:hypothetical protein n=1 Tax=Plantactinospora sp. KBS50 TaxID=2024580 RepID=UPI000BAB0DAF|nr:hypothetical protein [Plantactinospora sp. KBS50]ASW57383.1 hypothetical protein CIK06_03000 [Plantactinospora sp. KBS50]